MMTNEASRMNEGHLKNSYQLEFVNFFGFNTCDSATFGGDE